MYYSCRMVVLLIVKYLKFLADDRIILFFLHLDFVRFLVLPIINGYTSRCLGLYFWKYFLVLAWVKKRKKFLVLAWVKKRKIVCFLTLINCTSQCWRVYFSRNEVSTSWTAYDGAIELLEIIVLFAVFFCTSPDWIIVLSRFY